MDNSPAITEAEVYEVLRECYDPEIPVNIVDLGLIYGVMLEEGVINITMTLTAPGCHMGAMITQEIQDKLLGLPGCEDANIELVWDPPWNPQMMSDAAREKLRLND
ncbi:MAG TPA: iron-sulfur cluster assembly protein [Candidatus Binataceae bacterium]|nr:iron-sulfur cluster assembly protein [Candidatus Binataceae bacterium]